MDPQIAGYLLIGAHAFKNDPKLQEWEEFSRDELINYLNSYFEKEDFEESIEALEQYVKATLESSTLPIDVIKSNIAESEEDKEKRRIIKEKSHREVTASLDRQRTMAPKQKFVEKKAKTEEEKWQETQEKLTIKIQNQLISLDPSLNQDLELLEKLTEEIKTGVVSLALTEEEAELEKKIKPVVGEVLTKNGYLINNEKQEVFTKELYETSKEEVQEIRATNDSPIPQEVLNLYAQNNENVAFLPAYVLSNPALLAAYTQKAIVALPVKFLQQSASETRPEWQKMLKQGVFVENYDLTIQKLKSSGLSENHPVIVKLQKERGRLYDAQKTPEGKDKPLVGLLKTFFKPNELTGNQKGVSETTGISLSGKTLWDKNKGWAFNLKNTFNNIGLGSKIFQKGSPILGKSTITSLTSKTSIGAIAWTNRKVWRKAYLTFARTAAGKAIKIGVKKASVWVATKLGLQAAITAAGVGTGVGIVAAIAINLVIEAVSFVWDKAIKPLIKKISSWVKEPDKAFAALMVGIGVVVFVPALAIAGVVLIGLGALGLMAGAGAIFGGLAVGTVGFFTALIAGPVVGFSIVTAVIIGIIALSSLTFFIVMTTAGAFILPQGASLRVSGPPITATAPECTTPRHLAEQVVCQVQSCNIFYVSPSTISQTEECLRQSSLPNKEIIITYFKSSVARYTWLQCVGFVQGIVAAQGHPLEGRALAKNYAVPPPPSGYSLFLNQNRKEYDNIDSKYKGDINQIRVGDLPFWESNDAGHIMVVVNKDGNTITISNALGGDGYIGNGKYPASAFAGYLRVN